MGSGSSSALCSLVPSPWHSLSTSLLSTVFSLLLVGVIKVLLSVMHGAYLLSWCTSLASLSPLPTLPCPWSCPSPLLVTWSHVPWPPMPLHGVAPWDPSWWLISWWCPSSSLSWALLYSSWVSSSGLSSWDSTLPGTHCDGLWGVSSLPPAPGPTLPRAPCPFSGPSSPTSMVWNSPGMCPPWGDGDSPCHSLLGCPPLPWGSPSGSSPSSPGTRSLSVWVLLFTLPSSLANMVTLWPLCSLSTVRVWGGGYFLSLPTLGGC